MHVVSFLFFTVIIQTDGKHNCAYKHLIKVHTESNQNTYRYNQ